MERFTSNTRRFFLVHHGWVLRSFDARCCECYSSCEFKMQLNRLVKKKNPSKTFRSLWPPVRQILGAGRVWQGSTAAPCLQRTLGICCCHLWGQDTGQTVLQPHCAAVFRRQMRFCPVEHCLICSDPATSWQKDRWLLGALKEIIRWQKNKHVTQIKESLMKDLWARR